MTKLELEERLGFEVTREGFDLLNKMYMGCNLDKDKFAKQKLVKEIARHHEKVGVHDYATYAKELNVSPNGCWYPGVYKCEVVDVDVATAKPIIKLIELIHGDGWDFNKPIYSGDEVIVKR